MAREEVPIDKWWRKFNSPYVPGKTTTSDEEKQELDKNVYFNRSTHAKALGLTVPEGATSEDIRQLTSEYHNKQLPIVLKRLFGVGGEERYQLWPEHMARDILKGLALPGKVYSGEIKEGSPEFYEHAMGLAPLAITGMMPIRAIAPEISYKALDSLWEYAGAAYGSINKYLRGEMDYLNLTTTTIQKHINNLDRLKAEQKPLAEDKNVWRGVFQHSYSGNKVIPKDAKPGDVFTWKGYTSTSQDLTIAKNFGNTLLNIRVPAGVKALDMPKLTGVNWEHELTLPRNTKFQLLHTSEGIHFLQVVK